MAWTLKRIAISTFLVAHLAALIVWNMPACAIHDKLSGVAFYYMMPTGLWQGWGMFAPEPAKSSSQLEAIVRDRNGLIHHYAFPNLTDKTVLEGFWLYRHAKYGSVLSEKASKAHREFAARYVVRKLDLQEADFPIDLELLYQVSECVPPGSPPETVAPLPYPVSLERYQFPNLAETRP